MEVTQGPLQVKLKEACFLQFPVLLTESRSRNSQLTTHEAGWPGDPLPLRSVADVLVVRLCCLVLSTVTSALNAVLKSGSW